MARIGDEHFVIFAVTSRILRIPTEHKESKDSSDSKLKIEFIYSIEIRYILEVIAKTSFSKIKECSILVTI